MSDVWTFRALVYNVMLPVDVPLRYNSQHERASRIPGRLADLHRELGGSGLDVVGFCELIPPALKRRMDSGLQKLFPFQTGTMSHSLADGQLKLVSSGLVLYSRHPILTVREMLFETDCDGADCLAGKGVLYARIHVNGRHVVNVVHTHLQAWNTPDGRRTRAQQALQIRAFIDALNLRPDEPLVFMGDLNTDLYTQSQLLASLLHTLGLEWPELTTRSPKFSSDPATNQLMGNDETSMYASTAWPGGCYHEYVRTLSCPCCPRELLDFVVAGKRGASPVSSHMRVIPLKAARPFRGRLNFRTTKELRDLSDHYPVLGQFTFRGSARGAAQREIPAGLTTPRRPELLRWGLGVVWGGLAIVVLLLVWRYFSTRAP